MKIGIDASFLRKPGTGIGQVTANFLRKLAELQIADFRLQNGDRVLLYCEEEPVDFELPENFEVKAFLPFWKRDDIPRRMLWEREVAERAEQDGCDAFLSLYQSSTRFSPSSSVRHIMIVHDIIPRLFPEYLGTLTRKLHWGTVEHGIRSAYRIVTVSEQTKTDVVSELGVPQERIVVAYPDCDPLFRSETDSSDIRGVLQRYGLVSGYIYHGGGLEIRKNAERLLRSYAELRRHRDVPPLVISGKVFPASNRLATDVRDIARELGLEKSVRLLGFVPEEDLPALYRGAAFFVYPSLYEGFGLPVLEAFACGTPVLSGRSGSIPELADDAALLVDPKSETAIRSGMERLLDDQNMREELSEKGRKRSGDFSWNLFTGKVLDMLMDVK